MPKTSSTTARSADRAPSPGAGTPMPGAGAPPLPARVVIPAHQAAAYLERCLEGAARAGFAPAEITVVDDGSTDATAAIAREFGARIVSGPRRGAAAARAAGARAAIAEGAEILVFVDADVVMEARARDVIGQVLAPGTGLAAVFGAYDSRPAAPGAVSRFRNLLHRHVHLENAGPAQTFWTGLGAVRRAAYEAAGGFDPDQRMMEDVKFGMALSRAGYRIALDPRLQGRHLKAWTLDGMIRCDLFDRAIPWAMLLLAEGAALPSGLNTSRGARLSVVSVAVLGLALAAAPVVPAAAAVAGAATLVLAAANRRFLARLRREDGVALAILAVPLLAVHYGCGGAGYAWARLVMLRRRPSATRT